MRKLFLVHEVFVLVIICWHVVFFPCQLALKPTLTIEELVLRLPPSFPYHMLYIFIEKSLQSHEAMYVFNLDHGINTTYKKFILSMLIPLAFNLWKHCFL